MLYLLITYGHYSRLLLPIFEVPLISSKREQELQELRYLTGIPAPLKVIVLKRKCEIWV